MRFRTKPFPHQLRAVRRAVAQGNHAFLFDPRCGKTKASLDTIAVLRNRGKVRRIAIFGPIIAADVWVRQLQLHYTWDYNYLDVWGNKIKKRGRGGNLTAFFYVNTDKLSIRERRSKKGRWDHTYADLVEEWDPDLIVFDESHRLKRAGGVGATTAWHMVHRLRKARGNEEGDGVPFVHLLTGTPNPKGYIDLFAQFRIMDDRLMGTAKSTFEEAHCIYGHGRRQYTIIKYRQVGALLGKVRAHSTIVSSADAGLTGEYVANPIRLELPRRVMEKYDQLCEDFIVELENGEVLDAKNVGVLRMRLLQLTGGWTTGGTKIHSAKLAAFNDYARDLWDQGQSVVVGARFLPEVRALRAAGRRLGFDTTAIYGDVSRTDRGAAIRAFQRGGLKRPHMLVFQSEAGSLAIELTSAAEVVFYSLPDRWDTFWQFIQRLGGPNQKHWPVRYTALLARGTVDQSVLEALRKKRDMHRAMMNSPSNFLRGL